MRRNRIATWVLGLAALCCTPASTFATIGSGPSVPSFLIYHTNGIVFVFFLANLRTGTIPTCQGPVSGQFYKLAFDATTAGGKVMLAGLIAAHSSGEAVWPT